MFEHDTRHRQAIQSRYVWIYQLFELHMMMGKSLDIDSVRAFVLVADLASFTRAADALETAQAAVSLKIKRLETRLGCRLLDRTPRHVRLSNDGADFIDLARELLTVHDRALTKDATVLQKRLSIGISDHVAGPELPTVLNKLDAYDPTITIEINIAPSRILLEDFDRGDFDAVVARKECRSDKGTVLFEDKVGWFASPTFKHRLGEPLRLATLSESCGMRTLATKALDKADISWREAFVGGGVLAVGAAASAGLAVATLAARLAPPGTVEVGAQFELPALPPSKVIAKIRVRDRQSKDAIKTFLAAFRSPGMP